MAISDDIRHSAAELIQSCVSKGLALVTAESLTGGLLASAIVDIPGASTVFTGGAVVYATELKASLLDVDADFLAEHGPVNAEVAKQLAVGARRVLGVLVPERTIALSTTGVAGPDAQGGSQPGTVFIGVAGQQSIDVQELSLTGDRNSIQQQTVLHALRLGIRTAEAYEKKSSGKRE